MKIEYLKDHVENKQGDKVDVDEDLARYLIAVGAAKEAKKEVKKEDPKKKK